MPPWNMDTMETLKKCMSKDRFAADAGIELVTAGPGTARARMSLRPGHQNGLGSVMGGAIFTLADFAFAAASNSHGTVAVAVNANISFNKAVPPSGTLWAEAKENSKNFKLGTYTVEVRDDAGDLVALFQGMVYRKKDPLPAD